MDTLTDPYTNHVPSCIFLHNLSHAQMHANPELPAHTYKTSTKEYTVTEYMMLQTGPGKGNIKESAGKKEEMLAR